MIYNSGWSNLIPQQPKHTPALAAEAAKLLEAGETLTSVSRELNLYRATLRNWRTLNPALNQAFSVFEANKAKTAAHQLHVRKYKEVSDAIVDAARGGVPDPVEAGVKAHKQAEVVEEEVKPLSAAEREQIRINEWFNSDWGPIFEEQQAQVEAERDAAERDRCGGFWCG